MARKSMRSERDDFILTISDNEDGVDDLEAEEEAELSLNGSKKRKRNAANGSKPKASKRVKNVGKDGEESEGIWGKNDDDDGAMDSDFEFGLDANVADDAMDEFSGWGFDGAKKALGDKKAVDIDEIIERRRSKKSGETQSKDDIEDKVEEDDESDNREEPLLDDEDEYLAEDGFGMAVASDEEESDDNAADEEEQEDEESDEESVASEMAHPDDDASEVSEEEDEQEAARRAEFFAPEEKTSKTDQKLSFQSMSLSRPIHRGLAAVGFSQPTPIQAKTIPVALMGKDIVGGAVTGSGKTAAFIVPILERLLYRPKKVATSRVVILVPTRELAIQCHSVATKLASYTDIKFCLAVGGLSLKLQEAELRLRPDVIIATPGRFIDHMRNSASFTVDTLEILVLDEADRMLEDGFADELNEILTTIPKSRQTMLFSATMTSSVDKLIRVGMNKPARLMVDAQKQTAITLTQEFVRLRPGREEKRMGYLLYLCKNIYTERVIIFFRQKKEVHRARIIFGLCGLKAAELHGSMSQEQRISNVEAFRDAKASFMLATDLASRGLDIKGIDTVINYEAPQTLEIYVHRVGRTARAGREGHACTLAAEPDRKVVKQAVKAGRAQGAKIASRVIDVALADQWQQKVDGMKAEIEEVLQEEKEEKQMAQVEMQVRKGENIMTHEQDIMSRPKRTWFESERDKLLAKKRGLAELNGEGGKKKKVKLSNKDKKKLDDKDARVEGKMWKKGRAERAGKGAVANFKTQKRKGGAKKGALSAHVTSRLQPTASQRRRHLTVLLFLRLLIDHLLKLAPLPLRPRPHGRSHPRSTLLRYLFPKTRLRARASLVQFQLETLPLYKHRAQSRIYRLIVRRQQRYREKIAAGRGALAFLRRRGLLSPLASASGLAPRSRSSTIRNALRFPRYLANALRKPLRPDDPKMMPGYGSQAGPPESRERGARRRKLAGYLRAANEMRQTYQQQFLDQRNTTSRGVDDFADDPRGIPGAFPEADIVRHGDDEMILFPSYCKRHNKDESGPTGMPNGNENAPAYGSEDFWKKKWEDLEGENAIVDVDVRGWIYTPSKGPLNRKSRILVGLARQLSGLPGARQAVGDDLLDPGPSGHEQRQAMRDEVRIKKEADEIMRRGKGEESAATRGDYSERPRSDADGDKVDNRGAHPRSSTPLGDEIKRTDSRPLARKQTSMSQVMSPEELNIANANLMSRLRPFMTTPMVQSPVTIFFYNDDSSKSRTTVTDESGHFNLRAPLDFIPTHIRVLASESLTTIQEVKIMEPAGVSLISDIDDTVKHSAIASGAREIFRNTFVRELKDLTVEGVREWYGNLHQMGVGIHYVSNSPWQLYPVLASYSKLAGLPPGSYHLKQYSGMLQGIFEPVAERKKGTLDRIMKDFPERKFVLVGDSGEADLEVYTDVALANPGRILAVFIRDVTTPLNQGFFDSAMGPLSGDRFNGGRIPYRIANADKAFQQQGEGEQRPPLPARVGTEVTPQQSHGPSMGTLIDLDGEKAMAVHRPHREVLPRSLSDLALDQVQGKAATQKDLLGDGPPMRPSKPMALRSGAVGPEFKAARAGPMMPPKPGKLAGSDVPIRKIPPRVQENEGYIANIEHTLSSAYNAIPPASSILPESITNLGLPALQPRNATPDKPSSTKGSAPPPPPPRRANNANKAAEEQAPPKPPRKPTSSSTTYTSTPNPPTSRSSSPLHGRFTSSPLSSDDEDGASTAYAPSAAGASTPPVNRKVELWQRRWKRAKDVLDAQHVVLRSWRVGDDVAVEAARLVEAELLRINMRGRP